MRETDLYPAIKSFLEVRGFEVKAEVNGCDVVARRGVESPVIVELKLGFTLQLIYQAIDRLALADQVYIAVARAKRGLPVEAVKLCRRLGLGLIIVAASAGGTTRSRATCSGNVSVSRGFSAIAGQT